MGAYAYCSTCDAPLAAPVIEDFQYGEPSCQSCGASPIHHQSVFRETLIAEVLEQREKIATLEAALLDLSNRNKDDGK